MDTRLQKLTNVLGEVILLIRETGRHRFLFLGELDWLIIPPLLLNQFHIFRNNGEIAGFICWAKVSEPVHARLSNGLIKLMEHEWNNGNNYWIIDSFALEEKNLPMMRDFVKNNVLNVRELNLYMKYDQDHFEHEVI